MVLEVRLKKSQVINIYIYSPAKKEDIYTCIVYRALLPIYLNIYVYGKIIPTIKSQRNLISHPVCG